MSNLQLSVTICSWNTKDVLRECLASLRAVESEARFEVIVVDNNSEDGSAEMVQEEFPEYRLIRSPFNLGFTGGQNLALSERAAPHALLLNSDAVVHPGALKLLWERAQDPEVGVIGPKLVNPDGSLQYSCRRFPTPLAALFRGTPLARLTGKSKSVSDYLMRDFDHKSETEVDWVSGAALWVTPRAYKLCGGLDGRFFMYCEDIDYCKRVHDAGLKVIYFPDSVISHAIGKSTDKAVNRMIWRHHRSMLLYYDIHELAAHHPVARPFIRAGLMVGLTFRASIMIFKNWLDRLRRRFS